MRPVLHPMSRLTEYQKAAYDPRRAREIVNLAEERTAPAEQDDSVAVPTATYLADQSLRRLPRTLMGGTQAMRAAGTEYLPQHEEEDGKSYEMRLKNAVLYNAFKQTVVDQTGKLFSEAIVLEDVPQDLEDLAVNIDGEGRALTPFAFDLTKEAMVDGISFIFVDMPVVDTSVVTAADQRDKGLLPYWKILIADDVIGWRTDMVNGQVVLKQVRIHEVRVEPDGAFGEVKNEYIRVLEPGYFVCYKKVLRDGDEKPHWILDDFGAVSLPYIPLIPVYTNRTEFMRGEPPLSSLAELNLDHWNSTAEQKYALKFLRFAMLKTKGLEKTDKVVVGPNKVIKLPTDGDADFVEHSGAGIEAGAKDLEAIETRMRTTGMHLRVENAGQVSATAAAIDSNDINAGLKAVAQGVQDALEIALQVTMDFLGRNEDAGKVEVNKDFAEPDPPGTVGELSSLRIGGNLSLTTMWKELKRRRVLSEDFDEEKELVAIQNDLSMMTMPGGVSEPGGDDPTGTGGRDDPLPDAKDNPQDN